MNEVARAAANAKRPDRTKVYSRPDFRNLVAGKSPVEVIALIGRPDETGEGTGGTIDRLNYNWLTYNPVTDKVDWLLTIWFKGGVVANVHFY